MEKAENKRYGYSRKESRKQEKNRKKMDCRNEKGESMDDGDSGNMQPKEISQKPQGLLSERISDKSGSYTEFSCNSMGVDAVDAIRKKRKGQDGKYISRARKKKD